MKNRHVIYDSPSFYELTQPCELSTRKLEWVYFQINISNMQYHVFTTDLNMLSRYNTSLYVSSTCKHSETMHDFYYHFPLYAAN